MKVILEKTIQIIPMLIVLTLLGINNNDVLSKELQVNHSCITTPTDYINAFEACQPVSCVSPDLYAVIASQPKGTPMPTSIYPSDYQWAWVAGHENLELYASWQNNQCNHQSVTKNILSYVGFGPKYITPDNDYYLSVMNLSQDKSLFVPAFESWFLVLENQYHVSIPLTVQKAITLPHSAAGLNNPPENFSRLTGCDISAALKCSDSNTSPGEGCSIAYKNTAQILKGVSPPLGTGTTEACINRFSEHISPQPPQAAEVRALLTYCMDANPCNTGVGIGYNPTYISDPHPDPGLAHYTGREFVLDNKRLEQVKAGTTQLPAVK